MERMNKPSDEASGAASSDPLGQAIHEATRKAFWAAASSEPQEWRDEVFHSWLREQTGYDIRGEFLAWKLWVHLRYAHTAAIAASDAKLARALSFLLTLFHDDKTDEHQQPLIWKEIEAIGDTPSYLIKQLRELRQELAAEREKRRETEREWWAMVQRERQKRKPLVEALDQIRDQVPHFEFALVGKDGRDVWLHDFIAKLLAQVKEGK